MKPSSPRAALAAACVLVSTSACSGSSSGGGALHIVSCSLGCSGSGAGGDGQVTCGIADVFVNGELRISFSQPVAESSLSVFTLQLTEAGTGKTPPAKRFVDPDDPRVVVYRPTLTFDSTGSPVYGLEPGSAYTLKIPGAVEDPGSDAILSVGGQPNEHRLLCTLESSLGVLDAKPGAPSASVTVDVVTAYDATGSPSEFALAQPADGADNVYRFSRVTFEFDDLMNPATLVNPVTGGSQGIEVLVDPDGIVSDPGDQEPLLGGFTILLDQDAITTTVVFESELGFPSAGSDPLAPRRIAIKLLPSITDLGGNQLSNAGTLSFVPETILFEELLLREDFVTAEKEDEPSGGADWGGALAGALIQGKGGGSGRHGPLRLAAGQVVVLDTDHEDFSSIDDSGTWNPAHALEAVFDGVSFHAPAVTDGVFEFSALDIAAGSRLELVGSRPARLFVRGEASVRGEIEAAGAPAPAHASTAVFGGASAEPGLSAGAGGAGGRLPTWVGFESTGGTIIPPDPKPPPPTLAELDGADAPGVADNLLAPSGLFGGGGGGLAWPQPTPSHPGFHLPTGPSDHSGLELDPFYICSTMMKGTVGAGGAFGLDGTPGLNKPVPGGLIPATEGPAAVPGQASDFGLGIGSDPELPQRRLSPEEGFLHGGAGGGGGGSHVVFTRTNGSILDDCGTTIAGTPAVINFYAQASSACGGVGGGAVQLQAGRSVVVDGRLDATGGAGGSKLAAFGNATAGGGGAGGALLVQGPEVAFKPGLVRLDVRGGEGGFGVGGSSGGRGGAGLIRIETGTDLDLVDLGSIVAPSAAELAAQGASTGDIVSQGPLAHDPVGPNGLSGAQSCWFKPEGSFFLLEFLADELDPVTGAVLVPGFDFKVLPIPVALGEQPFRGPNELFPQSLEELLGTAFGASPVVVRFQGARAAKKIDDLCSVELAGAGAVIQPGSLTGWVKHPAELNAYFDDPALRPNLIRFQILFDRTLSTSGLIGAVTEVTVRVQPD